MDMQDHDQFSANRYREIDAELAAAEHEMEDADEQLRQLHEKQALRRKKQGRRFA